MTKLCEVTKMCFYKGKRRFVGDKVNFEGEKLPSYLKEIPGKPVEEPKDEKTEIIIKLQSLGIEFDGRMSLERLKSLLPE
jgi:hypothetical protein